MSLLALLAPFEWQHILIPVLPTTLIDVLSAPTPYFVGVLDSHLALVEQRRIVIESVVLVTLENLRCSAVHHLNNDLVRKRRDSIAPPFSSTLSTLYVKLALLRLAPKRFRSSAAICDIFMEYYASLWEDIETERMGKQSSHSRDADAGGSCFIQSFLHSQSLAVLEADLNRLLSAEEGLWLRHQFVMALIRKQPARWPQKYQTLCAAKKQLRNATLDYGEKQLDKTTRVALKRRRHVGFTRLALRVVGCCVPQDGSDTDADTAMGRIVVVSPLHGDDCTKMCP
jgi:hypothetical protein